jgi:hypothetical protein
MKRARKNLFDDTGAGKRDRKHTFDGGDATAQIARIKTKMVWRGANRTPSGEFPAGKKML